MTGKKGFIPPSKVRKFTDAVGQSPQGAVEAKEKTRRVVADIPESMHHRLKIATVTNSDSISDIIRDAVDAYLKKKGF